MVASGSRITSIGGTSIIIVAAYGSGFTTIFGIARVSVAFTVGQAGYRIVCASYGWIAAVVSAGIAVVTVNVIVFTSRVGKTIILGTGVTIWTVDSSGYTSNSYITGVEFTFIAIVTNNRSVLTSSHWVASIIGAGVVVITIMREMYTPSVAETTIISTGIVVVAAYRRVLTTIEFITPVF
jgi:hypothetical protein